MERDGFARAQSKRAISMAAEARTMASGAAADLEEIQRTLDSLKRRLIPRRSIFTGLCALCGEPCGVKNRYCHGCSWMTEQVAEGWESVVRTG